MPDTYSVMGMGYVDYGGGASDATHEQHGSVGGWDGPPKQPGDIDVADLTGPNDRAPDVRMTLTAREEQIELATGEEVDGYTLNGTSPGPEIRAKRGDLVEVTLENESVPDGVTLHWHGVDVPNAEDGVAGVTQDAVQQGDSHVYRFVAEDTGTYWYHSHQVSHSQVRGGLFGSLVVEPAEGLPADVHDVVAAVHTYDGIPTVNGSAQQLRESVPSGTVARVRVTNTDSSLLSAWVVDEPFRVVAVDGRDLNEPTEITGQTVKVGGGARVDLEVQVPDDGAVRVRLGAASLLLGPSGSDAPDADQPAETLDMLTYGSAAPVGFDPANPDRTFEYRIGRRPGFVDGVPGMWWSINGKLFPDVPMYVVNEGDVVRMTIDNSSSDNHPMHLHGHHAVVVSRNGVPATGSPWWVDSLEVGEDETYEIAFVADNPGVWTDHCHDLEHAADGMIGHLAYAGMYVPFRIGGEADNEPE